MAKAKKKFVIVGNWKMNPDTLDLARSIFSAISRRVKKFSKVSVIIAPPAPFISALSKRDSSKIQISAQDVSDEPRGAFTGSVSAREIKSSGADYAIIGHSERRAAGDTDEIVAKKVASALDAGLRVILCVGESQRDTHAHYFREIREQILSVMSHVKDVKKFQWVTVAYEPVWAVGKSYETALKPSDIHEMSIYIKKIVAEILGKKSGLKLPILYGGSVDLENAQAILDNGAIDGLLIGRQSLDPEVFGNIIRYAAEL